MPRTAANVAVKASQLSSARPLARVEFLVVGDAHRAAGAAPYCVHWPGSRWSTFLGPTSSAPHRWVMASPAHGANDRAGCQLRDRWRGMQRGAAPADRGAATARHGTAGCGGTRRAMCLGRVRDRCRSARAGRGRGGRGHRQHGGQPGLGGVLPGAAGARAAAAVREHDEHGRAAVHRGGRGGGLPAGTGRPGRPGPPARAWSPRWAAAAGAALLLVTPAADVRAGGPGADRRRVAGPAAPAVAGSRTGATGPGSRTGPAGAQPPLLAGAVLAWRSTSGTSARPAGSCMLAVLIAMLASRWPGPTR